jgi:putative flippase GtrA
MSETPQVDIVVPVKNEEHDLAPSVARLVGYLRDAFPFTARITIADNGSSDGTWPQACALEARFPEVRAIHLDRPGRGRALHQIWSSSDADVLAYMDVDLSTDLNALLPLVAPLLSGHSDVAIGTRLAHGSRVIRGPKREIISRCYNLLLRTTLGAGFSDAQCGFKAIGALQARRLLPLVEDRGWFFDTELLVLAERAGLRIHEVPVDWIDDADSRVDIMATAHGDLQGIARLGLGFARGTIKVPRLRSDTPGPPRALARFAAVGVASTVAYVLIYLVLRGGTSALAANALSLLFTAIIVAAASRRLTFGVRGQAGAARHQFRGLLGSAAGLALTSSALLCLQAIDGSPSRGAEATVLVIANLVATALRFALYRRWVFGEPADEQAAPRAAAPAASRSLGGVR